MIKLDQSRAKAPRLGADEASSPTRRAAKPFFNAWRLACLGLLIVSVLAYLPSLKGLKVWDDVALLNGSGIGGGESLWNAVTKPFLNAYFRPLVSVTFFLENLVWEGNPFFYHQTNILIHAAGTMAVVGLLLEAFRSRRVALMGGLVFAVAPAAVSTVAWIGGRTDSLCALLVTLFAYTLLKALREKGWARWILCAASVSCYFLAMLAKEQVVGLLPLVPAAIWIFSHYDGRSRGVQAIRWATPYLLAAALFAALWFLYYPNPFTPLKRDAAAQALTAGHTGVYYFLLLLLPTGRWMHTLTLGNLEGGGWPLALAGMLLWAGGAVLCVASLRKRQPGGFFALMLLLCLIPVSNWVPLPSLLVAPYRAGIALIGFSALIAFGLNWAFRRWPVPTMAVGGAWIVWCAWLTVWGASLWRDPITIFSAIIAHDPSSIVTRRNLSLELLNSGRAAESVQQADGILTMLYGSDKWRDPAYALKHFKESAELRRRVQENQGNEVKPESWLGELFAQRGFALAKVQDFASSKRSFTAALGIDRKNPRVRVALAQFALHEGKPHMAARQLRVAQAIHPGDPAIYALEGHAYGQMGRYKLAERFFRHSISMQPWFGPTYVDLATLQASLGDLAGAEETLRRALVSRVRDADEIERKLTAVRFARNGREKRLQL